MTAAPWSFGLLAAVLSAAAGLTMMPFGAFQDLSRHTVVWITAVTLVLLAADEYKRVKRRGANVWVSVSFLLLALYAFRYGFGGIVTNYWSSFPWQSRPRSIFLFVRWGIEENVPNASHLALLGGLGLYLGFRVSLCGLIARLPDLRWRFSEDAFARRLYFGAPVVLVMYVLGHSVLPSSVSFVAGAFGTALFALLAAVSIRHFAARSREERTRFGLLLTLMSGLSALVGAMAGMLGELLRPVQMVVLGYLAARGKPPWKVAIPTVALAFFFVFPWLTVFKFTGNRDMPLAERVEETGFHRKNLGYGAQLEWTAERFLARLTGTTFPAVFSQYFPGVYPYEFGRTFVIELSGLVPRVLWPGKPEVSPALNEYSRRVGIVGFDQDTSAVFDGVSEYYINFGLPGVLLLSALHAMYLNALFLWLTSKCHYIIGMSIFLALFADMADYFGFVQLFVAETRMVPCWLIIFYCLSVKTVLWRRPRPGASI